ncbi:alpha/beta hydrolase [Streptomyces roseirectus]|uniref:Alpha/beta hydrolase n=1 Tax=Streptomyces roseirectus TaxID=2768066 RepID=A0A7H0IRN9_9ACTN|nr:alpha/beta hydrolase [Streptomyces roseirectus]QNP75455.1 alpha/beta hydrolase [Streptomyces roseirectus]
MKLHTHTWGTGPRTAALIHGIMSDHRTWHRVGPALAAQGYQVTAVDLRGHGASPRGDYSAEAWADDLVDTLPPTLDLAIGHSLGGMALALAAARLTPAKAVYADPAWPLHQAKNVDAAVFTSLKQATRDDIATLNPRWSEDDIRTELATLAAWDPASAHAVFGTHAIDHTPTHPTVPSLVLTADPSPLIPPALATRLKEQGFDVRPVPGAGHTLHRDDFDAFMDALHGWI